MVSLKQSMIWRENTGDMRGIQGSSNSRHIRYCNGNENG
jgi:hypothetical protein